MNSGNENYYQELQNMRFLSHILGEVSEEKMHRSFRQKNVQKSRFEIYQRFILTLIDNVYETYLGADCIYTDKDIVGHFRWCYDKTSADLKESRFKFEENKELYDYFLEFFRISTYMSEDSRENNLEYFRSFFHFEGNMKNCDLSSFLDLYEIFDKTEHRGRNLVQAKR